MYIYIYIYMVRGRETLPGADKSFPTLWRWGMPTWPVYIYMCVCIYRYRHRYRYIFIHLFTYIYIRKYRDVHVCV